MAVFSLLKTVNLCILIVYMFHWQGAKAVTTTTEPDLCEGGFDPFPQEDKRSIFYNETTTINDRFLRPGWYGRKGFRLSTTKPDFSHCGTRYPIYQPDAEELKKKAEIQSVTVCVTTFEGSCLVNLTIEAKVCSSVLIIYNLRRSTASQSAYCLEKTNGLGFPDFRTRTSVSVSLEKNEQRSKQYRYTCGFYTNSETELYFQTVWYVNGVEITKSDFLSYDNITKGSSITDEDLRKNGITTVGFTISCGIRASFSNESEAGLESKGEGRFVGIQVGSWYSHHTPVINEGEEANIAIRLTDPVGFGHSDTQLDLTLQIPVQSSPCDMSVASDSSCGVNLQPNRTWGYNLKIRGTLTERYGKDVQVFRLYLKTVENHFEHRIWGNYSLSFDVYVKKDTSKMENRACELYSDPRLLTFKGWGYSMQLGGIFTLYKSLNYPIEVQVQTFRCDNDEDAYCVCGVVVRVGKTAFMINICHIENRFDVPEFIDYPICGDGPDVIRVTKSGTQYKMKLPNQGTVLVYINQRSSNTIKWLNVYIYPTIMDVGASRGLCGNLTDKDKEEKVLRNGATTSDDDTFFMSWRVPPGENLFDVSVLDNLHSLPGEYAELSYRTCSCADPKGVDKSVNGVDCYQTNRNNCTEDPGRLVSNKRCRPPTRRRRSLPSFFVGDNFPRRRRRNVGGETGWTEGKIEEYCNNLFDSANIVERCKDIPGVDLSTALNSCMEDIQLTGSTMFALSTLDTIRSKCLYEATMNVTLQEETPEKPSVLQSVKEVACPSECSNNGQCKNGNCVCTDGFIGSDCSTPANERPSALKLDDDGYCDRCEEMAVFGGTFIESDDFKCQLEVFKVENNRIIYTSTKVEVKGQVESIAEVTCPLPTSTRTKRESDKAPVIDTTVTGYKISVSNTGQLYSQQLTMVSVNSQCVVCNIHGDNVNCSISEEYCYTDNNCYRHGQSNILNNDYVCNSERQEWLSTRKSTTETKTLGDNFPLEMMIGVAVGGVLLVALIIVVVIVYKKRANRKAKNRDDSDDQRRQDTIPSVYDRVGSNLHDNNTSPTYAGLDEGKRELESDGYQQLNLYYNQHIK